MICRAGASTVNELTALGRSGHGAVPYVTNNHQEKNARALEEHGGVEVLLEKDSLRAGTVSGRGGSSMTTPGGGLWSRP